MKIVVRQTLLVGAALALVLGLGVACGSDSGGTSGTDTGGTVTPADTGGGGGTTVFRATLKDFKSKTALPEGWCYLLYNSQQPVDLDGNPVDDALRGEPVDDTKVEAGDGGSIEYTLPAGTKWGWFCQIETGGRDTYQFNIHADDQDEELWVVSQGLYELASQAAGVVPDQTKTMLAGRLVYPNPAAAGGEDYLGCMTVTLEEENPEGDPPTVHYFSNLELPDPEGTVGHSNPVNGLYMGANMELGILTITAKTLALDTIGTVDVVAKAAAIVISNIQATGTENPMTAWETAEGTTCQYQ